MPGKRARWTGRDRWLRNRRIQRRPAINLRATSRESHSRAKFHAPTRPERALQQLLRRPPLRRQSRPLLQSRLPRQQSRRLPRPTTRSPRRHLVQPTRHRRRARRSHHLLRLSRARFLAAWNTRAFMWVTGRSLFLRRGCWRSDIFFATRRKRRSIFVPT